MREATRKDTPKIGSNQSQCPICWKIFASDSLCESHKPWARHPSDSVKVGRIAVRESCISPVELNLNPRERADGVIVWSLLDDEESERRAALLAAARAKRSGAKKRIV